MARPPVVIAPMEVKAPVVALMAYIDRPLEQHRPHSPHKRTCPRDQRLPKREHNPGHSPFIIPVCVKAVALMVYDEMLPAVSLSPQFTA